MLTLAGAAQDQQPLIIMNGNRPFVLNGGFAYPNPVPPYDAVITAVGDLLRFADGSELHGEFKGIDADQAVVWAHRDSAQPLKFQAGNLDLIRFAETKSVTNSSKCRIRFLNGDEIPADITSLGWERIAVNTWFGGAAEIPRSAIQSITFLPASFSSGYEGPFSNRGWSLSPPEAWRYRDGVWRSRGFGALGYDMHLTGSCTVEFDITSTIPYHLMLGIYQLRDQIDYGSDSFVIELATGTVRLRRNNPKTGPTDLGTASFSAPAQDSRTRLTIQCNQEEKTLTILADGKLVRRWKDETGFVGPGQRISICDLSAASGVSLSNFRVFHWRGTEPQTSSEPQTNSDALWLANRDRASGTITGMANGKVEFTLSGHKLEIPLERITKIEFAAPAGRMAEAGMVRATLPAGTRLSLKLNNWSSQGIAAQSPYLGSLVLPTWMIRELKFNPDRAGVNPSAAAANEFGGLDD